MDFCSHKKSEQLALMVFLAVNAAGSDKLKPFVIGRAIKPRCFRNDKTLPTRYATNRNSLMTSFLFTDFFMSLDKSMRIQKRKILLFIDQCPAHLPDCNLKKTSKSCFFLQIALVSYKHWTLAPYFL